MSTKTIIIILVALAMVGGGYYMSYARSNPDMIAVGEPYGENAQDGSSDTDGKKMAFDAFVKQGGSYKCTVNQSVQGVDSTGTVYMDGGKMSGTFATAVQGMNFETRFIARDGYSYSWSSAMPGQGFKTAVAAQAANTDASTSGTYSFNAEQIGDYDCDPWTADATVFAIPASVKFTEMKSR